MKRNAIAFFAATLVLFATGAITASAQTAGGSILERVSYLLKDSYTFGFNSQGSSLTLRNDVVGKSGLVLNMTDDALVMRVYLGNLSTLSKAGRDGVQASISSLNTRLPIGTLIVADGGDVMMEHHVGKAYSEASAIAVMVSRFSAEAVRQRTAIFG